MSNIYIKKLFIFSLIFLIPSFGFCDESLMATSVQSIHDGMESIFSNILPFAIIAAGICWGAFGGHVKHSIMIMALGILVFIIPASFEYVNSNFEQIGLFEISLIGIVDIVIFSLFIWFVLIRKDHNLRNIEEQSNEIEEENRGIEISMDSLDNDSITSVEQMAQSDKESIEDNIKNNGDKEDISSEETTYARRKIVLD